MPEHAVEAVRSQGVVPAPVAYFMDGEQPLLATEQVEERDVAAQGCCSACVFDADRRSNPLTFFGSKGSRVHAE